MAVRPRTTVDHRQGAGARRTGAGCGRCWPEGWCWGWPLRVSPWGPARRPPRRRRPCSRPRVRAPTSTRSPPPPRGSAWCSLAGRERPARATTSAAPRAGSGGRGAQLTAELPVRPGAQLNVNVGASGVDPTTLAGQQNAFLGGGKGGIETVGGVKAQSFGGQGGGASVIDKQVGCGSAHPGDVLAVAGGGGGGGGGGDLRRRRQRGHRRQRHRQAQQHERRRRRGRPASSGRVAAAPRRAQAAAVPAAVAVATTRSASPAAPCPAAQAARGRCPPTPGCSTAAAAGAAAGSAVAAAARAAVVAPAVAAPGPVPCFRAVR